MISQTDHDTGVSADAGRLASVSAAYSAAVHTQRVAANGAPQLSRAARKPVPQSQRIADAQALEAHAARRQRLAAQIRVENPSRSEEEIEARLEQFGV